MPRATSSRMWNSVADQEQVLLKQYLGVSSVTEGERVAARILLARFTTDQTRPKKSAGAAARRRATGKSAAKSKRKQKAAKR
jgi:hypothetical protein